MLNRLTLITPLKDWVAPFMRAALMRICPSDCKTDPVPAL